MVPAFSWSTPMEIYRHCDALERKIIRNALWFWRDQQHVTPRQRELASELSHLLREPIQLVLRFDITRD